jgi:glycosyltransferase involved in cell wall biosynthesis
MLADRPRVLAISSIPPWQPRHGASIRVAGLLREARREFDIRLCCLATPAYAAVPPEWQDDVASVTVVDRLSDDWPRVALPQLLDEARQVAATAPPDVILTWIGPNVEGLERFRSPVVGDLIDCRTYAELAEWRLSTVTDAMGGIRRIASAARLESRAVRRFTHTMAAGRRDAQVLSFLGGRSVSLASNGVEPQTNQPLPDVPSLVFTGNLSFFPNEQAILWFAAEVWPAIVRARPDVRLRIAGRNPGTAVRALMALPGVDLHENVPDMPQSLAASWIALAPMLAGSGVKNKILEAWAAGRPAVMSHRAVNGLILPRSSRALVVSRPRAMRDLLLRLLASPEETAQLGRDAHAHVRSCYSWDAVAEPLMDALHRAIKHR